MKLLVTGGAGFIGSNFIHYWLEHNKSDHIINLDLLTYAGNLNNLSDLAGNPRYSFVQGNISDASLVKRLTADCDLIVNFAAETHVDRSIIDASPFIMTNVEGVRVLLDQVRRQAGLRLHHVSTDEVYGSLSFDDAPFNESHPYQPSSPYSASKASSDHLVRAYAHTYGVPVTISNCSNNYGPYQHPEKLIPHFITNLIQAKSVPLYGSGANIRDWLYVTDHCRAIEMIVKHGQSGETYCIGGQAEKSNKELCNLLLKAFNLGPEMINYVADRPGHDLRYAIDCGKIKHKLGWEPMVDFETGLAQTIAWYTEHEAWWRQLI